MVAPDPSERVSIDLKAYDMRLLSLRVWHGMALDAWLRVMRGRWHLVPRSRYLLVAMITVFSIGNQILKWASALIYGRRLRRVKIAPDPLFVIGHARSGTTWLNQLMMADPRHAAPTAQMCFSPETFLAGRPIIRLVMKLGLNETRPMDNVKLSATSTEEDEHGIYLSGAVSPMLNLMFPSDPIEYPMSPEQMTAKDAAFWRRKWLAFLTRVQFVNPGKRLVLKSPGHTLRTAEILRQFPNAKFIHILRDPYKIFLSTQKMRTAMHSVCALTDHLPPPAVQEATNIERFVAFHEQFEEDRKSIPEGQLITVRYEELRADPMNVMRRIYEDLGLDGFEEAKSELSKVAGVSKPYQNNQYDLDQRTREIVETEFADYFTRYGYVPMAERPKASQ